MIRDIGPRLQTAFRKSRVALWRFKRSPEQQDRAAMVATFAFIGLFAVGSVDAIITGGADFAPGSAYAAEYQPTRMSAPSVAPADTPVLETAAAEIKAVDNANYAYTDETLLGAPAEELAEAALPEVETVVFEGYKAEVWEQLLVETDDAAIF
jgi:hypothetical protein